jgi:hypothetical protein
MLAMQLTACQQIRDSLLRLCLDGPRPWLFSYSGGHPVLVATNRFDEAGDAGLLLKQDSRPASPASRQSRLLARLDALSMAETVKAQSCNMRPM